MKKFLLLFVLILSMALLFCACNDNGNVTDSTQSTSASSETESTSSTTNKPTENILVERIVISAEKNQIYIGETLQLNVEILPANANNKNIVWSIVQGAEIATVSETGLLTAFAPGAVVVRAEATDKSGVFGEYTVDIYQLPSTLVERITLSAEKTAIDVGETLKINAEVTPSNADNSSVIWSIVSGTDFATVSNEGILTGISAGTVVVRATAADESGVYGEITITVNTVIIPVSSVTITGAKDLTVGDTLQLNASVLPENATDKGIQWSIVSGEAFATVSENGKITAIAAGTVTVKAEAADGSGKSAEVTIKISPLIINVSSVTITGAKEMFVGDTLQLSASVLPENATDKGIQWSVVSGSANASVSSLGVVTAKKEGTVKIRATATDGSKKYAEITITIKTKALWEGSGTKNDPFLIRNLTDLKNLAMVLDKSGYYFRQVADIDCAEVGNWIVIGDFDRPFRHHIDGDGYTISNLCFDGEATALFQVVEDSQFKNMNIVNAHSSDNHVTYPNNTGKYPGSGENTGAIVGYGIGCSFENCTATVNFLSSNANTGGLIGFVVLKETQTLLMDNCHVSGTITSGGHTGGLIAHIWNYLTNGEQTPTTDTFVKNCSADVDIYIFTISTERACVGGLIGEAFAVKIEKCHTKGSITVIDGDVGGLIGSAGNYTDITRCYSEVDILATTDYIYGGITAGGLIGHMYSRNDLYDCYATGNISAPYARWSPCQDSTPKNGGPRRQYYNPCGSLIGTLEVFRAYSDDQKINVYNCYATGIVDVPNICEDERVYCHGALIGLVLDDVTVLRAIDKNKKDQSSWDDFSENYIGNFTNNYNLEDLRTYYTPINDYQRSNTLGLQNPKYTSLPTHEYVEIITEAELTNQSTFEGWDFENIWEMTENGPVLR